MEKTISFNILKKQIESFFEMFNLIYHFKEESIDINEKIKGRNYKTYNQVWCNITSTLEVCFSITFYTDSDSKSLISIYIYKYKKTDLLEFDKSMDVGVYFENNKKLAILRLEDYIGITNDEKIISFFTWLNMHIDNKLISILRENNWIETPLDWGRYK